VTLSVGEDFPNEQARVRECLRRGIEIGPVGAFYVMVCREALLRADRAAISGDPVEILAAYQQLKDVAE
jgi:hypothetical protein